MNILVFSDSHGRGSNMVEAFSRQIKRPDAIAFLGDGLRDLDYCEFGDTPLLAITGNCDLYNFYSRGIADREILTTLGGKKIMMVHGDRYSVKSGLAHLIMAADEKEADIVLFGHTHEPLALYVDATDNGFGLKLKKPIYLLNPGSVGGYNPTFGCVEISNSGDVVLSHGEI